MTAKARIDTRAAIITSIADALSCTTAIASAGVVASVGWGCGRRADAQTAIAYAGLADEECGQAQLSEAEGVD